MWVGRSGAGVVVVPCGRVAAWPPAGHGPGAARFMCGYFDAARRAHGPARRWCIRHAQQLVRTQNGGGHHLFVRERIDIRRHLQRDGINCVGDNLVLQADRSIAVVGESAVRDQVEKAVQVRAGEFSETDSCGPVESSHGLHRFRLVAGDDDPPAVVFVECAAKNWHGRRSTRLWDADVGAVGICGGSVSPRRMLA